MAIRCRLSRRSGLKRSQTTWAKLACMPFVAVLLTACNAAETSDSGAAHNHDDHALRVVDGDPERGRSIIASYACGVCHSIPGIQGAHGIVGPPLAQFARRQFIAGVAPNHPAILVRWVKDPPSLSPQTGMPDMGLTDEEARHVAAYLYTLR